MQPREVPVKKRMVLSFELDQDVAVMLDKAKKAGLVQGQIINEALRDCGPRVIKALADKLARKLTSLSFKQAEFQLAGFAV